MTDLNDRGGSGESSPSAPIPAGLWAALWLPGRLFHSLWCQLSPTPAVLAEQTLPVEARLGLSASVSGQPEETGQGDSSSRQ